MSVLSRHTRLFIGALFVGVSAVSNVHATIQQSPSNNAIQQSLQLNSIPFVKNQGQQHPDVAFYTTVPGGNLFVDRKGGLVYSMQNGKARWAFRESFSTDKTLRAQSLETGLVNLNIRHENGLQRVTTVNRLSLGEMSDGIRLELHAKANNVEKRFYIAPGANPDQIKVKLEGIEKSHIGVDGKLVMDTGIGPVAFTQPVAFQKRGNETQFVEVAYVLKDNQYGFRVGEYDKSRELVIDPVLAATYLGGSDGYPTYTYDNVHALAVAGDYIYAVGSTQAPDFPTALGYDSTFDNISEGFVVRMSADLTTLVNATFIGSAAYDVLLDSNGEVIVAGQANNGIPQTAGAYSYPSDYQQIGGFITRFSPDLTQLNAAGMIVPATIQKLAMGNGGLYFTGTHNQENLALTPNAYGTSCNCIKQGSFGANTFTGYMGRVAADLSALHALSWIGGSTPSGFAIAEDSSIYITNTVLGGADGAVRQFDADITTLLASHSFRYLGNDSTAFNTLALGDGFVLVGGSTKKNNLPTTPGAYDSSCGINGDCDNTDTTYYIAKADGFLVRYSRDLQTIQALTYIGGSGHDSVRDLLLDDAGNIVLNGIAGDAKFPLSSDAEQKTGGYFFARMSSDLTSLAYSTLASVSGDMTSAGGNNIYFGGSVSSGDVLPVSSDAFDTTYNGGASDGYILLYQMADSTGSGGGTTPGDNNPPVADAGADQTVPQKSNVTLNGSASHDSDGSIVKYQWTQLNGKSVSINNANSAVATFTAPRTRKGRSMTLIFELTVTDDKGSQDSDQITITVTP
ncbi:MAG: PKD domain-containing protein [Gammaproteobacteria bacterium]|nr:PKD domain-containing protein [Gammaproteobacteria bacterium]